MNTNTKEKNMKIGLLISLLTLSTLTFADYGRDEGHSRWPGRDGDHRDGDRRPPSRRIIFQRINAFQVQKLLETTTTLNINLPYVKVIQLIAQNNDVEITEARLLLDDGREIFMDGVTGGLNRNRVINYTLNGVWGERVRSITIRGLTSNLIGSRANIEVSAGIIQ
jgi:hypothetical protein